MPRRALLDSDILPYEIGFVLDQSVSEGAVIHAVEQKIESIRTESNSDKIECFLTHSRSNFRLDIATVAPYKGQRPSEKPFHWQLIRDYIASQYDCTEVRGHEADDIIADLAREDPDAVICSRDKDLDTVPGWHFRWKCGETQPQKMYYLSDKDADSFLAYQMIVGDQVDNIKGIPGVGKARAVKILQECDTWSKQVKAIAEAYVYFIGGGSNEAIHYEDSYKNKHWKTPVEIMEENFMLLNLTRYDVIDTKLRSHYDEGTLS